MQIVEPANLPSPVGRDGDDDSVLATAVAGCDCIITGDKDLLVLQRFGEISIVSPGDFLEDEVK